MEVTEVRHRVVEVDEVCVFYREAGPVDAPVLLLLHGFPSASHQFRRLIEVLGSRYRVIAPDYPGSGHTVAPSGFAYTFESLTDVVEGFVDVVGLERFVLYMFDFGGPVGLRLAERRPSNVAGLVIQNANSYPQGLSPDARSTIAERPGVPGAAQRLRQILRLPVTRSQYETGVADAELIAPDGWTLDQHFLDVPGRAEAQVALLLDYHRNVDRYEVWQRWLRTHRPPALVLWGRHDPFFIEPGAHAYRQDLPDAEVHVFDTGHFALEDHLAPIAALVAEFLDRIWTGSPPPGEPSGSGAGHSAISAQRAQ